MTNGSPQDRLPVLVLLALTLAGLYACYLLLRPFVPAFAWALALAVLFAPVHRRLERRLHRPNLAAVLSVTLVVVIVVVPAILVAARLFAEAAAGAAAMGAAIDSGEWQRRIAGHPLAALTDWVSKYISLPDIVGAGASWLTNTSAALLRASVAELVAFLLTFYFLFYFFRDGHAALRALLVHSTLSREELGQITRRVGDTIHATFYGILVCSAVQGVLGGLMFWWLELPSPVLWGVIMGLLSVVPVFGSWIVWVPTAAFLALDGHWVAAIVLTAWGGVVIGWIDNVLYPVLVGNRLRLHTVPTFVAVVGGLTVFGVSGVVLGPLVVEVTLGLLQIWRARSTVPV
jgi:predicted PurR-regulated permease PerM